jgi:hypothetical protein
VRSITASSAAPGELRLDDDDDFTSGLLTELDVRVLSDFAFTKSVIVSCFSDCFACTPPVAAVVEVVVVSVVAGASAPAAAPLSPLTLLSLVMMVTLE